MMLFSLWFPGMQMEGRVDVSASINVLDSMVPEFAGQLDDFGAGPPERASDL